MTAPPDEAVLVADTVLALGVVCRAASFDEKTWIGEIGKVRIRVVARDHVEGLTWVVSAHTIAAPGRSHNIATGAAMSFADADRLAEEDFGRTVAACADLERARIRRSDEPSTEERLAALRTAARSAVEDLEDVYRRTQSREDLASRDRLRAALAGAGR